MCMFVIISILSFSTYAGPTPDYYDEPGINSFRTTEGSLPEEAIDLFNGGLNLIHKDIRIPGNNGLDLEVIRSYRALQGQPGILGSTYKKWSSPVGSGWDMHFGRVWTKALNYSNQLTCRAAFSSTTADSNPVLELADGTRKVFYNASETVSSYAFITKDHWILKCQADRLEVFSPQGIKYTLQYFTANVFSNSGPAYHVTEISDLHSNRIVVEYNQTSQQGILTYAYFYGKKSTGVNFIYSKDTSGFYILKSLTANGRTWTYTTKPVVSGTTMVGHYYLTSAAPPTGNKWSYEYYETVPSTDLSGLYSLKSALAPSGTKLSYEYQLVQFDSSITVPKTTSLKKKTISSGDVTTGSWSYTFAPGTYSVSNKTTVIYPTGHKKVYYHFGSERADSGTMWKIGLLEKIYSYNSGSTTATQVEDLTWGSIKISSQNVKSSRNTVDEDIDIYAPIVTKKVITRDGTAYQSTYSNFDYIFPQTITEIGTVSRTLQKQYFHLQDPLNGKWLLGLEKTNIIDSSTTNVERIFDSKGKPTSERINNTTTLYSYCSNGEINLITEPNGNKNYFSCADYEYGIPKYEVRGYATTSNLDITRAVNNSGNITSETSANKIKTYSWNSNNQLTGINTPSITDSDITISWGSSGVYRTLTRGLFTEIVKYNGLGNQIETSSQGSYIFSKYNSMGEKTFESIPSGSIYSVGTSYNYDVLGRVTRIIPAGLGAITYQYAAGNKLIVTDAKSQATTYTFRAFGNPDESDLINITQPEAVTTSIVRSKLNAIKSVTQGSITRTYTRDLRNYLIQLTQPERDIENFTRDDNNNILTHSIGSTLLSNYSYDAQNRLTMIDYTSTSTPDLKLQYSTDGLLVNLEKVGKSTIAYSYTDNDLILSEKISFTSANPLRSYRYSYSYDDLDHITAMIYPGLRTYTFTNDALGRIKTITAPSGKIIIKNVLYASNSLIQSIEYGNGKITTFNQNNALRISKAYTANVFNQDYIYDTVGNLSSLKDLLTPARSFNSILYDGLNRLKSIDARLFLTYDVYGNLKTNNLNGVSLAYNYDIKNRLTNVTNSSYALTYDTSGNVVSNGFNTFAYDQANHMRQIGTAWISDYDGNNKRAFQNKNGKNIYSFYRQDGKLIFQENMETDSSTDFIYINDSLVAKQKTCGVRDDDLDGIPTCDEIYFGLNPKSAADAALDMDKDGISNLKEYQANTNMNQSIGIQGF
ncbi:MAG: hypothetical protein V4629_02570 [Pseudomonadota bacterium]